MVGVATRLIDSLDKFQKPSTVFKFDSADRLNWHYFPEGGFTQEYGYVRNGLTLDRMDPKQRHLAYGLMSTGLSRQGFVKAMDVMTLEEIVRVIEDDTTGHRDAENFHFTIFGTPSLTENWGWRVEGHHLSLHYTIKNGELVSSSPTFFGANPHEVAQGPHKGMIALARGRGPGCGTAQIAPTPAGRSRPSTMTLRRSTSSLWPTGGPSSTARRKACRRRR